MISPTTRRIGALILLVLLIGVPFIDWKLGAVLWMCAWLVYIFQNLIPGRNWKLGQEDEEADGEDDGEDEPGGK